MLIADLILGLASPALQVWLTAILFRGQLHKRFPIFTIYTLYAIVTAVIRTFLSGANQKTYFYVFWTTEVLYALLGLLAIYEAFREIFGPLYAIRWFPPLVYGVILATLAISVGTAIAHPPAQIFKMGGIILSLEIGVRFVQGGIFALCWGLRRFFRIESRRYPLGIVYGFGIAAVGILAAGMFRSEFGTKLNAFFQFAPAVSYIMAVLLWLMALRGPESRNGNGGPAPHLSPEEMRDELRRYLSSSSE